MSDIQTRDQLIQYLSMASKSFKQNNNRLFGRLCSFIIHAVMHKVKIDDVDITSMMITLASHFLKRNDEGYRHNDFFAVLYQPSGICRTLIEKGYAEI